MVTLQGILIAFREDIMKILVIGDNSKDDTIGEDIKEKLFNLLKERNDQYIHYDVNKENLKHCIGCFGCWLKTPGICVFDDIGRKISRDYIQSDAVIFVSPVKYGCYSVSIRRVLDRLLPNILPFFEKYNNKLRHEARYKKYPQMIVIGYSDCITDYEIETFKSLTDANSNNFHSDDGALTYVCKLEEDVEKIIGSLKSYFNSKEGVEV